MTNDFEIKKGKNGKPKRLKDIDKAYRAGYLDDRKDNAKCYNVQDRKRKTKIKTFSKYGKSSLKSGSFRYI